MTQSASEIMAPLTSPEFQGRLAAAMPLSRQDGSNAMRVQRTLQHMQSLLKTEYKLREADRGSLYSAVFYALSMGLEVLPVFGHCYFIPFAGEVKLIMGYQGLMELVRRSGKISTITAVAVHEGDAFEVRLGCANRIDHEPRSTGEARPLTHTYAVAFYSPTEWQFAVMERHEIETTKARSKGAKKRDSPWNTDFERMAIKTAIIRLCKQLPKQAELAQAIQLDTAFETGHVQDIEQQMLPAEARDTLADGTPRSEASLHEKMEDGAVKQGVSQADKLRKDIGLLVVRFPESDREPALKKVLDSVGWNTLQFTMVDDIDKLVDIADRLEATLAEKPAQEPPAATNTADAAPPAADDEIPY